MNMAVVPVLLKDYYLASHSKFFAFVLPRDFGKTYDCKTKDYYGKTMDFILSTSWYKFV